MRIHLLLASGALLALQLFHPPSARAETFHTCAGFITSLPATISTQGVWCLKQDLSTAITNGNAITIATNNVTIDCNDFKLGGLAGGASSTANGIHALTRLNATVRHCKVRGFLRGIYLSGGGGHLVEDNRLDNNLAYGIIVTGDNNQVRRNAVYDTGGAPLTPNGIYANADILDNIVSGVFATATNNGASGITVSGAGNQANGNHVQGLVPVGTGYAFALAALDSGIRVDGNHVTAAAATPGYGVVGIGGVQIFCSNNTVLNFSIAYASCTYSLNNLP